MLPLNLHEYEEAARGRLEQMYFDYVAGAACDQTTLRANRAAFERWRLLPRMLRGPAEADLRTTVLGQPVSMPVLLAPVGMHRLVHNDGERASARAARAAGTIFTLSTVATYSIEEVAQEAGPWWFQLYVYRDRAITRDLVQRAEAAGASALLVTVDTPVLGRREADERNRFVMPEGLLMANLQRGAASRVTPSGTGSGLTAYTSSSFEPALTWADLDWVASLTRLPVIPKGVLAAEDARIAVEQGARGVLVSNHGGRQLDGAVATLDALPAVAAAVGGRAEVLLDGGVRRGTDVLKALALGARAVLIGRPYIWGLAAGGEAGVARVLSLMRAEVANALTLTGCARPDEVTRRLVVPEGPVEL